MGRASQGQNLTDRTFSERKGNWKEEEKVGGYGCQGAESGGWGGGLIGSRWAR